MPHSTDEAGELSPGDPAEGRGHQFMEPPEGKMTRTLGLGDVSTRLRRIATLARQNPQRVFTSLHHTLDIDLLREAFRRTRKDGAPGVDGQTAADYQTHLEDNLQGLLERFRSGTYRAPPVRRVLIPKGDGKSTRSIGIPTFEDKILQRAVQMVLEAVYEQDFRDCSFGFRPGRSPRQALKRIWRGLMNMGGGWVIDADLQDFFGSLDRSHLRRFLDQRVRDGVLRRALDKWLRAGVQEEGGITLPDAGTPQGGVISPLLSNIYLHEVLDVWFEDVVRPRLEGDAFLVRYADDFVIVCARERDARRVLEVLPKRFAKYGLTLHPEKTRRVQFQRPRYRPRAKRPANAQPPGTFDLLGFTLLWAPSRSGRWTVKLKTSRKRFTRAVRAIKEWCRYHRHLPIREQHRMLMKKLRGHCQYYGAPGNFQALSNFRYQLLCIWRKWLDRRSQRARMAWERFNKVLSRYPIPHTNHLTPIW